LYYDVLDDCNDDVILTTVISYIKNKAMLKVDPLSRTQ